MRLKRPKIYFMEQKNNRKNQRGRNKRDGIISGTRSHPNRQRKKDISDIFRIFYWRAKTNNAKGAQKRECARQAVANHHHNHRDND